MADPRRWKVAELRAELQRLGATPGKGQRKDQLLQQLLTIRATAAASSATAAVVSAGAAGGEAATPTLGSASSTQPSVHDNGVSVAANPAQARPTGMAALTNQNATALDVSGSSQGSEGGTMHEIREIKWECYAS